MGGLVTFSAVLSMIGLFIGNGLGGTRVPFAMAADGMMPKFMVKVHPKYGTPWVAILFCGLIYSIFSLSAFAALVVIDVFLNMLVLMAEFFAMWKLRFAMPHLATQESAWWLFWLDPCDACSCYDHWACHLQPICRRRHGIHFVGVGCDGDRRCIVFPDP